MSDRLLVSRYPNACPNGGGFGHVEPVWGIYSNHSLDDPTVYPDDYLVHSSDQDLNPYYRAFHTLEDTPAMDGNCAIAQKGFGRNEMYLLRSILMHCEHCHIFRLILRLNCACVHFDPVKME